MHSKTILAFLLFALLAAVIVWQAWLGLTIQEIGVPGIASVKFSPPTEQPRGTTEFDLSLRETDATIPWSREVRRETNAIIPDASHVVIAARRFQYFTSLIVKCPADYADTQCDALKNAAHETAEIGRLGLPRRYEIGPAPAGASFHFVEITVVLEQMHRTIPELRCREINLRFVEPSKNWPIGRDAVRACREADPRIWVDWCEAGPDCALVKARSK